MQEDEAPAWKEKGHAWKEKGPAQKSCLTRPLSRNIAKADIQTGPKFGEDESRQPLGEDVVGT